MFNKNTAIQINNLSKCYRIGIKEQIHDSLGGAIVGFLKSPIKNYKKYRSLYDFRDVNKTASENEYPDSPNLLWALKGLSFQINQGEVVGIIGANGAGKSTLLKVLARITTPTAGKAMIRGRVGSLLEVGTGFHPELTGRENVYLNGTVLGMRKREVDQKFHEIVEFSGVEKFLDTPVKRYSSGMRVRLAFAVAAHLEPEVLIIDEVLAVGDAAFQKKCLGKMGEVATEGRTVLFVSHNMGAVSELCERAIWLDEGQVRLDGRASDVVSKYLSTGVSRHAVWICPEVEPDVSEIQLKSARVVSARNVSTTMVDYNDSFRIEIAYEVFQPIKGVSIALRVTDAFGNILWTSWDTDTPDWNGMTRNPGSYISSCGIPGRLLRPGQYQVSLGVISGGKKWYPKALTFEITPKGYRLNADRVGLLAPNLDWIVKTTEKIETLDLHG